ncbi:unnamed protein product [Ixodes pacificus]
MRRSSAGLLVLLVSLALLLDTAAGFEILRLKKLAKLAIIGRALAPQIVPIPSHPVPVPVPIPVPVHHHHHIISHAGHVGADAGCDGRPALVALHRGPNNSDTVAKRTSFTYRKHKTSGTLNVRGRASCERSWRAERFSEQQNFGSWETYCRGLRTSGASEARRVSFGPQLCDKRAKAAAERAALPQPKGTLNTLSNCSSLTH